MTNEQNKISTEQVYAMFEELKGCIEKTPAGSAPGNADAIMRKLNENTGAVERTTEQVATLVNRIGQTGVQSGSASPPPYLADINDAFNQIKTYCGNVSTYMNNIHGTIKTVLSDQKIEQTTRQAVSREVAQYQTMLNDHWAHIETALNNLYKRIPRNYDINKRLVWACV